MRQLRIDAGARDVSSRAILDELLIKIKSHRSVEMRELLAVLCAEKKQDRVRANFELANAFRDVGDFDRARVFAERSWRLSDASVEVGELLIDLCREQRDFEVMRTCYKALGMRAAAEGDVPRACHYFNLWQYVYSMHAHRDHYEHDYDILHAVEALAVPERFQHDDRVGSPNQKIRVAYLLAGISDPNATSLMKGNLTMARWHSRQDFEVFFISPESADVLETSECARKNVEKFQRLGYEVQFGPSSLKSGIGPTSKPALLSIARQIKALNADILVTCVGLALFEHYFIACLRPAPILISLVQGVVPTCAIPGSDHCIAWSKHPLMDTPVDCSLVDGWSYDREAFGENCDVETVAIDRSTIGIPADAFLIVSGGRHTKLQNADQWSAVSELLLRYPQCYFAVTADREQVPAFETSVNVEVRDRVRFVGWRPDFVSVLASANLMIDTYPSGGGQTILEAIRLGIPVVAHENDYWQLFDQGSWCPVDDFLGDSDLVISRGDFAALIRRVGKLIDDRDDYKAAAKFCESQAERLADAEGGIRRLESSYKRIFAETATRTSKNSDSPAPGFASLAARTAELDKLNRSLKEHIAHVERERDLYRARWMKVASLPIIKQVLALRG